MASSSSPPHHKPCSSYPPPPLTASKHYISRMVQETLQAYDLTELSKLVTKLCYAKETDDSSELLYKSFKHHFPNLLAVRLIHLYISIALNTPKIRSFSLSLLSSLLTELDQSRNFLKIKTLMAIKTHLNACLLQQETSDHDFKLLSRIISHVALDVFIENIPWDELCSFIIKDYNLEKRLLIFSELPLVLDEEFLIPLLENNLDANIIKGLVNPGCDEEWCLALEAGFNMTLQLIRLERKDMVWDIIYAIVKSVWEMVNLSKKEVVVRKGLVRIARKVRREALRFREDEYEVVSRLSWMMRRINGVGEETEMAAEKIQEVLDSHYLEGKALDLAFIKSHICLG